MVFPTEVKFDIDALKTEIDSTSESTAIYIGADSKQFKRRGKKYIAYVTVLIIHYNGSRGAKIHKQITFEKDYGSFRQRLMKEVELAINVGYELADTIANRPFEIHLDINPDEKYRSSVLVKEATGYVMGMLGFKPKLKPEAFAASAVSDRWAVKNAKKYKTRGKS